MVQINPGHQEGDRQLRLTTLPIDSPVFFKFSYEGTEDIQLSNPEELVTQHTTQAGAPKHL